MFFSEQQLINAIFNSNLNNFDELCLHLFRVQYKNNKIYRKYCNFIGITDPTVIRVVEKIPFLPVSLFKTHQVLASDKPVHTTFFSSATGGSGQSKHYLTDITLYQKSFITAFELKFGSTQNYCFLALLPSYIEREGSSLIYMVQHLMNVSAHPLNGFFLYDHLKLQQRIKTLEESAQNYVLFGVSFALLDFVKKADVEIKTGKIIETGGMKGRKKEMTKMEVQQRLQQGLKTTAVYSEYGMTELLSQAYAKNDGMYDCPPWMKVFISDPTDPFVYVDCGKTGVVNVIDLANINSCCFIQTSDLGRKNKQEQFEVLGRLDHSDLRGCSLMI
ncbi:MAG: acyl transferase [Bacteroidia bacterium]|nr:acyl transferase [Bacteroidia bacterium]